MLCSVCSKSAAKLRSRNMSSEWTASYSFSKYSQLMVCKSIFRRSRPFVKFLHPDMQARHTTHPRNDELSGKIHRAPQQKDSRSTFTHTQQPIVHFGRQRRERIQRTQTRHQQQPHQLQITTFYSNLWCIKARTWSSVAPERTTSCFCIESTRSKWAEVVLDRKRTVSHRARLQEV